LATPAQVKKIIAIRRLYVKRASLYKFRYNLTRPFRPQPRNI